MLLRDSITLHHALDLQDAVGLLPARMALSGMFIRVLDDPLGQTFQILNVFETCAGRFSLESETWQTVTQPDSLVAVVEPTPDVHHITYVWGLWRGVQARCTCGSVMLSDSVSGIVTHARRHLDGAGRQRNRQPLGSEPWTAPPTRGGKRMATNPKRTNSNETTKGPRNDHPRFW